MEIKSIVRSTPVVTRVVVYWFVVAQTASNSHTQTNQLSGTGQSEPVIAVSPNVLNFGLVGVGREKQLELTVQNVGGGILNGTATVAAPFKLSGNAYWLQRGQSQSISVRYAPTAEGTNTQSVVFSGGNSATVLVTGYARQPPRAPGAPRVVSKGSPQFSEEEQADFIVRYYSDQTSYLLKPSMMDGAYRSICDRPLVLKVAAQQPRREMAVAVLNHYPDTSTEETVKATWVKELGALGYQRVIFLRGNNKATQVNGLPMLESRQAAVSSAQK